VAVKDSVQRNRGPSRTRLVRIAGWLLILFFPVLAFGLIEITVRLLDIGPVGQREAEAPAWLDRNILVKESRWMELLSGSPSDFSNYYRTYVWDRYLFYKLRPGLDLPLTDVTAPQPIRAKTRWVFHTNSRGFNSPEVRYEKTDGAYRIVTLGDSSTFGWGVDTKAAYPRLLRSILEQRHPGAVIEVVNLGVCGYSSLQGRVLMEREALRYRPDLVTISYGSNDFSLVPEAFDAVYARNRGWTGAVREALNRSRAYQVYASLVLKYAGGRHAGSGDGDGAGESGMVLNVGPEESAENLARMAMLAKDRGIDAILVTNCVPGDMVEPNREAAARTGTPLLDTGELLGEALPDILAGRRYPDVFRWYAALYGPSGMADYPWLAVYLTDRCHPNVIGHGLIAERLATMVEEAPSFAAFLSRR